MRFALLFNAAAAKTSPRAETTSGKASIVKSKDGLPIARLKQDEATLILALDRKNAGGFAAHLVDQLPDLFAAYQRREGKARNANASARLCKWPTT